MRFLIILFLLLLLVCCLVFFQSGSYLIVNDPKPSDAIITLGGDRVEARYKQGLELLAAGYGKNLIVDVVPGEIYGHSDVDLAREYIAKTAGASAPQVSICTINGDSTKAEAPQAAACLQRLQPDAHSAVIVTDNYHTRRALSIFRDRAPQYQWTAASARDPFFFGLPWWKNREWAKTYLMEVQKLVYWELWDRWRK